MGTVRVSSPDRRMATDRYGIDDDFLDTSGVKRETSRETRAALQAAMGVAPEAAAAADGSAEPVRIWRPGDDLALPGVAELVLEDGTSRALDGRLPEGLPFGYHR